MPNLKAIDVIEQESTSIVGLSDHEALCLKQLGEELRGGDKWWGKAQDEGTTDESDQRKASVIKVGREPGDHGWNIQVGNAIGVIGVGDLQINVLPKIGERHFNHIANMAVNPSRLRFGHETWRVAQELSFLPSVWGALIEALSKTLRADLHHDYEEVFDDPPYIRGRLDVRSVSVNLARGLIRFPATFDELTSDNSVNRILRAAAEYVAIAASNLALSENEVTGAFYKELAASATESAYRLCQAGPLRSKDLDAETPRLAVHQRQALDLSHHVLSGIGRSLTVGNTKVTCFLQPTPDLIEDGVRALLDTGLGEKVSVKKRRRTAARLSFNPDLVIEVDGDPSDVPTATGDVKYRIRKEDWPRDVLLQAMGFAQVFTAGNGFFIDFSHIGENHETKSEKIRDISYHHITWPTGNEIDPAFAEEQVLAELQRVIFGVEHSGLQATNLGQSL